MVDYIELLESFRNKKVLVTGHTGFKGSWFSFILDSVGASVLGYSLAPHTKPNLFESLRFSSKLTSVYGDIRDFPTFSNVIKDFNPEFIFHMAAQPLVLESYQYAYQTHMSNYVGTLNLLEILNQIDSKATTVFITTDKVYRNLDIKQVFEENNPLGGDDPYSASKAASEILISSYYKSFFKEKRIGVASVRAGNVIGGGDWSKDRLIPDIVRAAFEGGILKIRNTNAIRPWQHVLEPLFGYLLLAKNLKMDSVEYSDSWNFGPSSNSFMAVSDILDQAKFKGLDLNIQYQNEPTDSLKESQFLILNSEKAKKKLQWNTRWDFEKTIVATYDWYSKFYQKNNSSDLVYNDLQNFLNY
jgi:CDP-glucose 4,6-dehydratase